MAGRGENPVDNPPEDLLEPGVTFVVAGEEVDPAQHGYTAVHNYANYFWRPYLGNTAFSLWELLLSFCYGEKDIVFPSISRLARMLTNSDHSRAIITGRRRARLRAQPETGDVSSTAAVARCEGALDVLRRERLIQIFRDGEGRMSNYTFRLCKTLPVLRPDQVTRLSPALQLDHRIWLRRRGIDPQTYQQAFAAPGPARRTAGRDPCRRPSPASAALAAAARTSPAAPRAASSATHSRGAARDTRNHPQEEHPWNQWWQEGLNELRPQLMRDTFVFCLLSTRVRSFRDGVLTLRAASGPVRDLLEHRLRPLLLRTLAATSHGEVREIVVEEKEKK